MNHNLLLIIVSGALINNVVLSQFLGICSFLGVSQQMKASASLGGAVIFVMTIHPRSRARSTASFCIRSDSISLR